MPYFYPLSRCQRCNQIFFSRPKINYLIHSRLRLRVYTRPRVSRTSSKRGSLAVEQNIDDGEGEEEEEGRGGGGKTTTSCSLVYTKYNRSPQLSSETSASTRPPSSSLPMSIEIEARVARARNDTRWPLRFKAPDICGIKKLFPMNGRRSVVSARMLG